MEMFNDAHVHFGQRGAFDPSDELASLMDDMNRNNIKRVFIFPVLPGLESNLTMSQEIKKTRETSERFILFAYLNPVKSTVEELELLLSQQGFRGIKLHPRSSKFAIDDFVLLDPWMRVAETYNCHVIVHCTSDDSYCSPLQMERLVKRYQNVTFQMAHLGAIWNCSEGIEVVKRNDNLYADTSIVSYSAVKRAIKEITNQLLLGTDYPFYRFEMEQLKLNLAVEDTSSLRKVACANFDTLCSHHNY